MIDKDTQLCISVASRPSNFGTTLHNAAYAALGLNFVYNACADSHIAGAIAGVRALGNRGCSVSMPFKQAVVPCLDALDRTAREIGAVNTVVNDRGVLTGYNTDVVGARRALQQLAPRPDERVLVLGAGGAARAVLFALRELGMHRVAVAARDGARLEPLRSILPFRSIAWAQRQRDGADVLVNATPVGMRPDDQSMPVDEAFLDGCRAVMDVVISPMETKLIGCATAKGKLVAPGYLMSLEQAMAQFTLYAGVDAPRAVMERHMRELLDQ